MQEINLSRRLQCYRFICRWILPIGFIALLSGLVLLPERSIYHKFFYALVAAPCALALILEPSRNKLIWKNPLIICFLVFSCLALLSIAWSETDTKATSLIKRPLYITLLFAAACLVVLESRQRLVNAMLLAAVVIIPPITYSLFEFISAHGLTGRFIGPGALDNPLLSSHLFGFFFIVWLTMGMTQPPRYCLFALLPLCILGAAIVATGSRTPLVATALACLWLMLTCWNKRALTLAAVALLSLAAILLLHPDLISNRGFSYRPYLWGQTLNLIKAEPWFGHGFDTPLSIYIEAQKTLFREPHNLTLAVAYYTGCVGLALWLAIHTLALWQCWKNKNDYLFIACGALMVYGLGAGITEGGGLLARPKEHWFLTWIPIALIIAFSVRKLSLSPKGQMTKLCATDLNGLAHNALVLEQDGLGPKVLKLTDDSILKLFRKRPLLSRESLNPYACRFAENAKHLQQLGFTCPDILHVYWLDDPVNGTAVHYRPLPGQTLRKAIENTDSEERHALVQRFGELLANLHAKGVYFRSAHLGNVLLLPDGNLGLIDLADMQISGKPLTRGKRRRNLKHIQRYEQDRHWLFEENLDAFKRGYASKNAKAASQLFST
ncbi:O-antigen ligase family protein [Ectopseudomonas mendocina]|uniref:O-antigen ligase family protein n=1 Tax=Ectopseudomonas mendocina TaxID=300 RepID=A0ABZ2RDY0_ECTME